jgi:hypothetical protein
MNVIKQGTNRLVAADVQFYPYTRHSFIFSTGLQQVDDDSFFPAPCRTSRIHVSSIFPLHWRVGWTQAIVGPDEWGRLLLDRHLMFPSQSCGTSLLTRPLTISYALHRSLHWLVCLPPSPISLCSGPGIPYIAYILGLDTLLMLVWM